MEKIYDVTALGEMLIDFAVKCACNVEQTWKKNRIHWKSWG